MIFVSKQGGWVHKNEFAGKKPPRSLFDVSGYDIRWSQNGVAWMTFDDLNQIVQYIEQAKELLNR